MADHDANRWMAVRRFSETLSREQVALLAALNDTTSQPGELINEVLDHNRMTQVESSRPVQQRLLEAIVSYAVGRQTSAVRLAIEEVEKAWPTLSHDGRERVLDIIDTAFDAASVGADIDSRDWDRILVLGGRASRHEEKSGAILSF